MVAGGAICPQNSLAEGFSGQDFLAWSQQGQESYVSTSIVMATLVATRTNTKTAACLETWYALDAETRADKNTEVIGKIKRNADYHPSAVILLVMEEACGSFSGK